MYSVTSRIRNIKQPWGGYINRKAFSITELYDGKNLNPEENIAPGLIGMVVDYLTRLVMGASPSDAFRISLMGASIAKEDRKAIRLLHSIKGLNNKSIYNACKLVGYDVCYRVGMTAYKPVNTIKADKPTIENIAIMVQRSVHFWNEYGPIIKDGFTFEGGYTPVVSAGDGDYLTQDTLWDFKVSKKEPNSKYTLQLLMYYIMGLHSIHEEFKAIKNLGIYNPRKNKVYLLKISSIPQSVIDEVSYTVIGYGITKDDYINLLKDKYEKQGLDAHSTKMLMELKLSIFDETNAATKNIASSKQEKVVSKEIHIGASVSHKTFGIGTIIDVQEVKNMQFAIVDFKAVGQKKILLSYLTVMNN